MKLIKLYNEDEWRCETDRFKFSEDMKNKIKCRWMSRGGIGFFEWQEYADKIESLIL